MRTASLDGFCGDGGEALFRPPADLFEPLVARTILRRKRGPWGYRLCRRVRGTPQCLSGTAPPVVAGVPCSEGMGDVPGHGYALCEPEPFMGEGSRRRRRGMCGGGVPVGCCRFTYCFERACMRARIKTAAAGDGACGCAGGQVWRRPVVTRDPGPPFGGRGLECRHPRAVGLALFPMVASYVRAVGGDG